MKTICNFFDAMKRATGVGFRGILQSQNVFPMFSQKQKTLRKLFTCKGFRFISVIPLGFEPRTPTLKV